MGKEIQVGDLVMVVKPSACGLMRAIGNIFKVAQLKENEQAFHGGIRCVECSNANGMRALDSTDNRWCMTRRLIRIDPPALPESVNQEQEIHA